MAGIPDDQWDEWLFGTMHSLEDLVGEVSDFRHRSQSWLRSPLRTLAGSQSQR
jgi:hypothetical protein